MISTFNERLKNLRVLNQYNNKQMADLLNISPAAYGRYEQGIREPKLKTVAFIASFFDVSTDWLLGASNDMHQNLDFSQIEQRTYEKEAYERTTTDLIQKCQEVERITTSIQEVIESFVAIKPCPNTEGNEIQLEFQRIYEQILDAHTDLKLYCQHRQVLSLKEENFLKAFAEKKERFPINPKEESN